jgi:integrase
MPSGIVKYVGSRGTVWRIRYEDASGKQVQETLGRSPEWSKRKAEAALRARQVAVERDQYRRPDPVSFTSFAREWLASYPQAKGLKRSTIETYKAIVETHLIPAFGSLRLGDVYAERIDRYVVGKRRAELCGRTVNRHLNVLSLILKSAVKRRLITASPMAFVERPKEDEVEWRILPPAEVRSVERAFVELIAEAEDEERAWRESARVVFLLVTEVGLRRGEVLGLRWRAVSLADPEGASLRVSETIVRGRVDTPKSEAGRRTHPLSSRLAAELFDHHARSAYSGDDDLVFVSPHRGTPINPKRYAGTLRAALAKAGITDYVRQFQDGRHSSITNAARHGRSPMALMTLGGHSDFKTTQRYIHLAGQMFRDEAARMETALWGSEPSEPPSGTNSRYKLAPDAAAAEAGNAA